jgi:predicted RNA-binding Zn ribbon-like protein
MDIDQKRKIGEQVEPGGRAKAPGRLELFQRFVNTWNHDLPETWDRLGTPRRARAWLQKNRLIARDVSISAADTARLREVREALRSIVGANGAAGHDPTALHTLRAAALAAPLTVTIDGQGHTRLCACSSAVDGAVATLLGIMHDAQLTGDWARLKTCRQCEYAFFDRSRNRSAAWCSMSICGNRNKNRAHYRRLHPPT